MEVVYYHRKTKDEVADIFYIPKRRMALYRAQHNAMRNDCFSEKKEILREALILTEGRNVEGVEISNFVRFDYERIELIQLISNAMLKERLERSDANKMVIKVAEENIHRGIDALLDRVSTLHIIKRNL